MPPVKAPPETAQATRKAKRKRGAQPGNQNAFKHGFYSRQFQALEAADLDAAFETGLANEIAMLRVATRRFFELSDQATDIEEAGRVLSLLAMASSKLAAITRIQHMIGGSQQDTILQALQEAIQEVLKEKLEQ